MAATSFWAGERFGFRWGLTRLGLPLVRFLRFDMSSLTDSVLARNRSPVAIWRAL